MGFILPAFSTEKKISKKKRVKNAKKISAAKSSAIGKKIAVCPLFVFHTLIENTKRRCADALLRVGVFICMKKEKTKKKGKRRRLLRNAVWITVVLSCLFLLAVLAIAGYAAYAVHPEEDEILFQNVRQESITRFYYNEDGGETVEGLPSYHAKEWESERLSGGETFSYVPISEMPECLKNAFVAIEDHRFYHHGGVDILRTGKAILNNVFRFSSRFGGSTITQQLIKNIGGEKEKTAVRKLKEMLRAYALEKRHTKEEILEAYLNVVPMSGNCVGVGAGALRYFGKTPEKLTLAEAASIAAVVRAPALYDPERHPEAHIARRNAVLKRMHECGMISEEAYAEAVAQPLLLREAAEESVPVRSWYTEQVIADVRHDLVEKGYSEAAANALLYGGGIRIYTAVDLQAQKTAEAYFSDLSHFDVPKENFCASLVLLSPQNGDLLALIGNAGKKNGNFLLNHAKDTLRAPGSALKPIALYAPAIEEGKITEATVFDDVPSEFSSESVWPHNSPDVYDGLIPVHEALARSKNTVAVSLYRLLGAEHVYSGLVRLGIRTVRRQKTASNGGVLTDLAPAPLALGELTDGVSLLSLSRAYLPLADEGRLHKVRSYLLVTDREGKVLLAPKAESEQIFSQATASVMTHMLQGVAEEGSAASLSLPQTVDTAGKTGTSGGARDRFFVGYTPYYLCGVWCGYASGGAAVSGTPHLQAFDTVMLALHQKISDGEEKHFAMAQGLTAVRVCRDSGMRPSHLCALDPRGERVRTVWLPKESVPHGQCTVHKPYYYSEAGEGIVTDAASHVGVLKKIALVEVLDRSFSKDIRVADAEYTCRPLHGVCASENGVFYAGLLSEGEFIGVPKDGKRPYNAAAHNSIVQEQTPPLEENKQEPHENKNKPKKKRYPLDSFDSFDDKRKQKNKNPLARFFSFFGGFWS